MNWFLHIFNSSVGRKVVMALTGLFLTIFLLVHVSGNFLLFAGDGGQAFNEYSKFMTTFPLIRIASIITFAGIILHSVQAAVLTYQNKKARPARYAYRDLSGSSFWSARNMGILGTIILVFLIIHLRSFWFEMKFGEVPYVNYGDGDVKDLYSIVVAAFSQWWYVVVYLVSLIALSLHLIHGIQSGFRSLGWVHRKYTPIIKGIGYFLAVAVPLGFASQPVFVFLKANGLL